MRVHLIFFLTLFCPTTHAHASSVCASAIEKNVNAATAAKDYPFENSRSISEYRFFLGREFGHATNDLKKEDTIFDSGGGFGIASLQLASEIGLKAIVANAQDNYHFLREARAKLAVAGEAAIRYEHTKTGIDQFPDDYALISFAGVPRLVLRDFGDLFGFDLERAIQKPRTVKMFDKKAVTEQARDILDEVLKLAESTKSFEYKVGFVETILPTVKNVKIITDVFGAFFYSPARVEILNLMQAALKPGSSAYLSLMGFAQRSIHDEVVMPDGSVLTLIDYLVTHHADHFRLNGNFSKQGASASPPVLVMKRLDKSLKLPLTVISTLAPFDEDGMRVPRLRYRAAH